MKRLPAFILLMIYGFLSLPVVNTGCNQVADSNYPGKRFSFVTFVSDSMDVRAARAFISSVRQWGGEYSRSDIYVVADNESNFLPGLLQGSGVFIVPLEMDSAFKGYPLAIKAFAAAQVEKTVKKRSTTLAWFDPSTLLFSSPADLDLRKQYSVSIRPVTLQNRIGMSPETVPDDYWSKIYDVLGLDYNKVPVVKTIVGQVPVRAYYNCEIFSVDPQQGICELWKNTLTVLLNDMEYQENVCNTPMRQLFLHQAVLSGVIVSKVREDKIKPLALRSCYPFNQHERFDVSQRVNSLNEINAIILDYVWEKGPGWTKKIPVDSPLREWLGKAYEKYK